MNRGQINTLRRRQLDRMFDRENPLFARAPLHLQHAQGVPRRGVARIGLEGLIVKGAGCLGIVAFVRGVDQGHPQFAELAADFGRLGALGIRILDLDGSLFAFAAPVAGFAQARARLS